MYYYVILLALIIILRLILNATKFKNKNLIFLNISFIMLFLFLALRSENIGTDLANYKIIFNYNNIFSLSFLMEIIEPGYAIYSYIIYHLTGANYQFFLAITAFFSLIGVYYYVRENSNNYLLSIIIYISLSYYLFVFSGLRQALALSITLYSIKYIKTKKLWKFLLVNGLAFCFHKSAIVFFPAYFMKDLKIKNKHIPILIGILSMLFIFRFKILSYFMTFIYDTYSSLENANGGFTLLFIYLIMLVFSTLFKKSLVKDVNSLTNLMYNMLWVGIMIQIFATVEGNAFRAAYYYFIPLIAFFSSFSNCFKKSNKILIDMLFSIILIGYFIITVNGTTLVSGYEFFWMK